MRTMRWTLCCTSWLGGGWDPTAMTMTNVRSRGGHTQIASNMTCSRMWRRCADVAADIFDLLEGQYSMHILPHGCVLRTKYHAYTHTHTKASCTFSSGISLVLCLCVGVRLCLRLCSQRARWQAEHRQTVQNILHLLLLHHHNRPTKSSLLTFPKLAGRRRRLRTTAAAAAAGQYANQKCLRVVGGLAGRESTARKTFAPRPLAHNPNTTTATEISDQPHRTGDMLYYYDYDAPALWLVCESGQNRLRFFLTFVLEFFCSEFPERVLFSLFRTFCVCAFARLLSPLNLIFNHDGENDDVENVPIYAENVCHEHETVLSFMRIVSVSVLHDMRMWMA